MAFRIRKTVSAPPGHPEQSEKSFQMHMVKNSQSLCSFEMMEGGIPVDVFLHILCNVDIRSS
ncbi:MAG: hypothetical protein MUD12_12880 [Spirochaetes bacterium]|nr:hypothetical protein [Spirochaetota bacterium]